jgi:hypothetical protein
MLEETPQANGTILRRGRGKAAGFTLEWEEKPTSATAATRQARVFTRARSAAGPVFDLEPAGAGGRVSYALEWEPLTWSAACSARGWRPGGRDGGQAHPRSRRPP